MEQKRIYHGMSRNKSGVTVRCRPNAPVTWEAYTDPPEMPPLPPTIIVPLEKSELTTCNGVPVYEIYGICEFGHYHYMTMPIAIP